MRLILGTDLAREAIGSWWSTASGDGKLGVALVCLLPLSSRWSSRWNVVVLVLTLEGLVMNHQVIIISCLKGIMAVARSSCVFSLGVVVVGAACHDEGMKRK